MGMRLREELGTDRYREVILTLSRLDKICMAMRLRGALGLDYYTGPTIVSLRKDYMKTTVKYWEHY